MDEIDIMRRMRDELPPPQPADLLRARSKLLREVGRHEPVDVRSDGSWIRRLRRPRATRTSWRLLPITGLALLLVAGLMIVGWPRSATQSPDTPAPHPEAATILLAAAATARQQPALHARPDQYVFIESITQYGGTAQNADGTFTEEPPTPEARRAWWSVDGTRDGLISQKPLASSGGWQTDRWPGGGPAYRADLPTDSDAMLGYLYRTTPHNHDHPSAGPASTQIFAVVGDLIREIYLPPASLAALYKALAEIPGITVTHNVLDASGRHGTAVGVQVGKYRSELIFDPATHQFLGERTVATQDDGTTKKGTVTSQAAQLRLAIVDKPGQLP